MSDLRLIDFPAPSAAERTVPDVLREIARMIDDGRIPRTVHGLLLLEDTFARVAPYGIGRMTVPFAVGLLEQAKFSILMAHVADVGEQPSPAPPPAA